MQVDEPITDEVPAGHGEHEEDPMAMYIPAGQERCVGAAVVGVFVGTVVGVVVGALVSVFVGELVGVIVGAVGAVVGFFVGVKVDALITVHSDEPGMEYDV